MNRAYCLSLENTEPFNYNNNINFSLILPLTLFKTNNV